MMLIWQAWMQDYGPQPEAVAPVPGELAPVVDESLPVEDLPAAAAEALPSVARQATADALPEGQRVEVITD